MVLPHHSPVKLSLMNPSYVPVVLQKYWYYVEVFEQKLGSVDESTHATVFFITKFTISCHLFSLRTGTTAQYPHSDFVILSLEMTIVLRLEVATSAK